MIYHLRIKCYANKRDWSSLFKLANDKKSPIGYKAFAIAAIK
jgi:hypothetical protein